MRLVSIDGGSRSTWDSRLQFYRSELAREIRRHWPMPSGSLSFAVDAVTNTPDHEDRPHPATKSRRQQG
jgi:hypothetical protein